MHFVDMKVAGIEFKVLKNCKAIKINEQITMPNEKPAKKKPRSLKVVIDLPSWQMQASGKMCQMLTHVFPNGAHTWP